jgi:predicted ATPase
VQSGHVPTIAIINTFIAVLGICCRNPDRAAKHAECAVGLARKHGLAFQVATATSLLGWARGSAGDPDGEAGMLEGLALYREMGGRLLEPVLATSLAELQGKAGRVEAALATSDAAIATIEQTGERWFEAEAHRMHGELLLKRDPPDAAQAESAFLRAIEITRSQQTRSFELRSALSLAKLYHVTGRHQAARELLVPAVAGFAEGGALPEVAEANRLLASREGADKGIHPPLRV